MSVMLFHSSFISFTTPFSALMAQFTGTALWEALLWLGMCVCVRARVRSVTHCHIFLSSPFKLCQRLDKKYSVELFTSKVSRAKLLQNSGFGSSSDPATEHYCAFLQTITQLLLFIVYPFMFVFCFLFFYTKTQNTIFIYLFIFSCGFIVTFGIIQNPFSPKDPTLEAKKLRRAFIFVLFFILICPPPLSTVPPSR